MDGGNDLKLIVFGDEHLHNSSDLVDRTAKLLNLEVENLADLDTSNSLIHKKIVKKIISLNNTTDCIFLIGWTSPYRLDAEYRDEYFTYQKNSTDYKNPLMNKLHKYDDYLFNRYLISQRWCSIVYGVQQLLEAKQIKYYMFNTVSALDYNRYTENTIKNLNTKFYYDSFNKKSAMKSYLEIANNKLPSDETFDYAKFLAELITDANLLENT